jgi:hypothetical protein
MAQGITMLQFTERNVIEGLSSLPQSTHFLQCRNVQRIVQSEGVIQSNAGLSGPARTNTIAATVTTSASQGDKPANHPVFGVT